MTEDDRPSGTVTFLFSDIEGSTRYVQDLGPATYRELLEQHHRLMRAAFATHGGNDRGTQGDAFLVVFGSAPAAVAAAVTAQRSLAAAVWPQGLNVRVRMGLHAGEGIPGGDDYVGVDINRAARIAALAHGGQVLISESVRALASRSLTDGVTLRRLGEHHLRGLTAPERLYQVTIAGLPSDFPPLRSRIGPMARLPTRVTSFVGREADLAELQGLLAVNRLLTLLGPGGTGKTSLAVELARSTAERFADGAWFVPLETVTDPDLVGPAIASALGLHDLGARPIRDLLLDNLAESARLLVLDNFEQVLGASPLIADLLAGAPALKLVVTSRAPMHLAAEQLYQVAPLPLPASSSVPLDKLGEIPSIRLFVDRARKAQPSFALSEQNAEAVDDICRRLDGLPLGIELAAAKVSLLGAEGIRRRLAEQVRLPGPAMRDAPARQRTLRDTVAWSHDLLAPAGRELFARLAVFLGGWRPEELVAIFPPGADPLDTVSELVDQSLVVVTERGTGVRFELLETIRQFAAERFAEADDRVAVQRRHALAYLAVAEAGAAALPGRWKATVLEDLAAERDNLRAALRWSLDGGDAEVGLRIATALSWYWVLRGEIEEGRTALTSMLAVPAANVATPWRMRALEAAGTVHYYAGDHDRATELYRAQLRLARELGDQLGVADALFNLPFAQGTVIADQTWAGIDEAERIYAALGDERKLARVTWLKGTTFSLTGRPEDAEAYWSRAYELLREVDDPYYEALAANSLGPARLAAGDHKGAARWLLVALGIARDVSDVTGMTISLPILAAAVLKLVGPVEAATIAGAYEALSRRFGVRPPAGLESVVGQGSPFEQIRASLDPFVHEEAMARGRRMTPEQTVAFAFDTLAGHT